MKTDMEKYIKEMKVYTKKVTSSPEKAKDFLSKTGVYNADGSLHKNYGGAN